MMEFPLLEPGDFQEAKGMTRWAFELSEAVGNLVMVRSVTRLSHASGMIMLGEMPRVQRRARFSCKGPLLDPVDGPVVNLPGIVRPLHRRQQENNQKARALTFCPGCPHRASFWSIHNALELDRREGFVSGDIGCYSLAAIPCGFESLKTLHAMGSGTGTASGFAKLSRFGFDQPIFSLCGDSTLS